MRRNSLLHEGTAAAALTGGYHLAWAIGTDLLVAAIAAALAVLRRPAVVAPSAEQPAELEQLSGDAVCWEAT